MRTFLLCLSLALNAFCAGGMFTFPLMSPALAIHNKLSQPQLTTIILAGMMSQYPVAVVVGTLVDRHGPALCTLIGGLMFIAGFGGFSLDISHTVDSILASQTPFYRLVVYFLFIGLGTVFSYCSCLFAASKYFASYIGLASGATMTIFALSPLFYSVIATKFFMAPQTGLLNVAPFTAFLALITGFVAVLASITFQRYPIHIIPEYSVLSTVTENTVDETTPLVSTDSEQGGSSTGILKHPDTLGELVKTIDFWLLASFCVFILGSCEMVISNIGSISASLPPAPYESTTHSASSNSSPASQVKFLAVANTASRLVIGPLADFISPTAALSPSGILTFPRKHIISRFSFLSSCALLLSFTLAWMEFGIQNQAQLWVLSVGTGLSYGATFTVLPSLISSLWGLDHVGRNFGIMMFAPFTGTPIFSYIYAAISALHTETGEAICKGRSCWQITFSLSMITSVIALFISLVLWRRWKSKI